MNAMPADYRTAMVEDQRRLILQHLAEAPEQCLTGVRLRVLLTEARHQVSADGLAALLGWLDEAGLIVLMGTAVPVARLTQRGEDVARGLARHPGVAQVRP